MYGDFLPFVISKCIFDTINFISNKLLLDDLSYNSMLIIFNQSCTVHSSDFEITHLITS